MKKNIYEIISEKLMQCERYVSESGKLLKANVYSDIMTMNKDLLKLLLDDEEIKNKFFIQVNNSYVFDKQGFSWFIESKEFLPDSYTLYENKIGLASNRNFLSRSNDVVIDFPYKDCVLEGTQANEKEKKNEIFFNEIIANEEITRMFSPKVFTNIKRYNSEGITENINLQDSDNLIIKGNNLIALWSLLKRFENKVKCIYIDPPYNTGNDSFKYNDSFNHSSWLTFMKNRLEIAKRLLNEKGCIYVQIDNSPRDTKESPEFGYLQVLMDEIFERKNYITTFTWKKKGNASNTETGIGTITESIFLYAKNIDLVDTNLQEYKRKYDYEENGKLYNLEYPVKTNEGTYERSTMLFPIVTDEGTFYPPEGKRWTLGEDRVKEIVKNKKYMIKDNKFYIKKYQSDYVKGDNKLYNNLLLEEGSLKEAKKELFDLGFPKEEFDTPKPERLIKKLLEIATNKDDLVLDFFLGSGTTAAVAQKMNRRYIGIEQMDYIKTLSAERILKVIKGELGGISKDKDINWKGGGSFVYCELKENGQELINKIISSNDEKIKNIKKEIYNDERIIPYVTRKCLKDNDEEFEKLSLEDKKKALISIIDKNKLYVNYSDIEDEDYNISEEEKKFTKSFYGETN